MHTPGPDTPGWHTLRNERLVPLAGAQQRRRACASVMPTLEEAIHRCMIARTACLNGLFRGAPGVNGHRLRLSLRERKCVTSGDAGLHHPAGNANITDSRRALLGVGLSNRVNRESPAYALLRSREEEMVRLHARIRRNRAWRLARMDDKAAAEDGSSRRAAAAPTSASTAEWWQVRDEDADALVREHLGQRANGLVAVHLVSSPPREDPEGGGGGGATTIVRGRPRVGFECVSAGGRWVIRAEWCPSDDGTCAVNTKDHAAAAVRGRIGPTTTPVVVHTATRCWGRSRGGAGDTTGGGATKGGATTTLALAVAPSSAPSFNAVAVEASLSWSSSSDPGVADAVGTLSSRLASLGDALASAASSATASAELLSSTGLRETAAAFAATEPATTSGSSA